MMPNFTFPLHKCDSKKRLNRQQVLLRLAPTLVKVNDLMPLRQEFSNSAPKIFGVEYTDSTTGDRICLRRTCRVSTSMQSSEESNLSLDNTQSSSDSSVRPASGLTGGHSDGASLAVVASERSRLFNPRHSRTTSS